MIETNPIPPVTDIARTSKSGSSSYFRALVAVALAAGLILRLVGLHYPPYDSHSFRQCQTLSTIDDFYRNGIDLLHPHTLYMGNPGLFVLELPLFQATGAGLYHVFGPHVEIIRVLNILFGAASAWVLYLLTLRFLDRRTAVLAALVYWLSPLNILYHRSTLLDPMGVLCGLTSFYCLLVLLDNDAQQSGIAKRRWLYFSVFFVAAVLTALIKALYLWPAVLLLGHALLRRGFRFDSSLLGSMAVFAIAGVCFIFWNRYAALANATNPLTGAIEPASLLGISKLFDPHFYLMMLKTRPKAWLGPAGGVFYLLGAWACWAEWRQTRWRNPLFLVALVPPTYLLAFSNINFPHDYYQLVITPFLAIIAAVGISWLANRFSAAYSMLLAPKVLATAVGVLIVAAVLTYAAWFRWPQVDTHTVAFEKLSAGKFESWAPAILWGTPDVTGQATNSYLPAFLYAGKLWGFAWVVPDASAAKGSFQEVRKGFKRLDYVVFYGTEWPKWMESKGFQVAIRDDEHRFFVFQAKKTDEISGRH